MLLPLFFFLLLFYPFHESNTFDEETFMRDSEELLNYSYEYAKFYELPDGTEMRDVTEEVLKSSYVSNSQKQTIREHNRRLVVFSYPSDGLKIKGLVSYVPNPHQYPLLVLLRGGHEVFGVLNPGSDLVSPKQYTVLSTMYRGGVSEGRDEFGGKDVDDVNNLVKFIPELEQKIGVHFQNPKTFLMGRSRGGMEMFQALARFPDLQNRFAKVVSLSGMLDIRQWMTLRPDMEEIFMHEFGYQKGLNEKEWMDKRDPLLTVSHINQQLPILIIQGTADERVSLAMGQEMISKLRSAGNNVTYWEIEGATHCLNNVPNRAELILNWLDQ